MYTDLYLRKRNWWLSAVLGVIALVITGAAATVFFSQNSTGVKASQLTISSYEIVNIAPRQVSVLWKTDERKTGWIIYGTDPKSLTDVAIDERDISKTKLSSKIHIATLKPLKPNTKYYFKFVVGNTIVENTNGSPYELQTVNETNNVGIPMPIYGKVTQKSGSALANAIVIVRKKNSFPLVTLTKMSGEWLIPLQTTYDFTTKQQVAIQKNDEVEITITDDELISSKVRTYVDKAGPLPQTIVLGTNYEFLKDDNVLPASTKRLETIQLQEIDIMYPKMDAIIPGTQPLIKGVALPNTALDLTINSQPIFNSSTRANSRGEWMINVPKPLSPGSYTLTVQTKNAQNEIVQLTRNFTLVKSGEQVLAAATDAATPTIEPSPTGAEPTAEPSQSPTPSLEPTVETTKTPSASESATVTPDPNAPTPPSNGTYITITPAPPISGSNGMMYTVLSVGLLVVGAGVMFLF